MRVYASVSSVKVGVHSKRVLWVWQGKRPACQPVWVHKQMCNHSTRRRYQAEQGKNKTDRKMLRKIVG